MSFMVIVEFLSNLIRPLALTFRLTANIIAGHLLMSLITGFIYIFNLFLFSLGYLVQSLLTLIEIGVSFIQAYVFFTLLLLYLSERGV
jgi:F-type H+-transporting ATPase subunit a